MNAKVIGFSLEELLEQADGFRLPVVLQVNFSELQKQGPSFTHHALLNVEVGKLLERPDLFGSELGNAFVNGDGLLVLAYLGAVLGPISTFTVMPCCCSGVRRSSATPSRP